MEDLVLSCLESRVEENRNLYARFLVGPFFKGDALTVATALRRVLLSSIESVAITALYIQGITHEFSSIVGVRESVLELSLNFQSIVLCYDKRFFQKKDFFDDVQIGYLQVQGPKVVYANDLKLPLGVKVVDPTQYIATISREGVIVLKFTLGKITNSSNQHSSFHASLPTTKQAISQQLLRRNIVKAKSRCSYKKNYAVNPNLYCYPSIKGFVRAVSSTAQLIGEPRSGYYQPLVFANSYTKMSKPKPHLPLANVVYVSPYKPIEQNTRIKASENGASRALAVKAVNKAKSFFNTNCYVQSKNLRGPFCKKKRFKENGSNHFISNTKFYPQSFFFYNANNTQCKLIKPIKKKSYTKHTSRVCGSTCKGVARSISLEAEASPKVYFSSCHYKCVGMPLHAKRSFAFAFGKRHANQSKRSLTCLHCPRLPRRGHGHGQGFARKDVSHAHALRARARAKACRSKDLLCKEICKAKLMGTNLLTNRSKQSLTSYLWYRRFALARARGIAKLRQSKKLCPCKPTHSFALQNGHRSFAFAGDKSQRMQRSNDSKSNYRFNKTVNQFRLIENVFQSDICLHNIIPLDSSLSPVLKVNFLVEIDDEVLYLRQKVRERIILEVWTNGSIHPRQALHDATLSLLDIFSTFRSIYQTNEYSSTLLKVPEYNKR